jgi:hypothetical protein
VALRRAEPARDPCGIYRTDVGLEVRAGYSDEDLLHSRFAVEIVTAREVAEAWRQAIVAKGSFEELGPGNE